MQALTTEIKTKALARLTASDEHDRRWREFISSIGN